MEVKRKLYSVYISLSKINIYPRCYSHNRIIISEQDSVYYYNNLLLLSIKFRQLISDIALYTTVLFEK